ncbi:MAG: hypothetical protein OXC95_18175 [Dehalococcoidia bacterium]|nr:hypothetical protein [Dehalococcoidia bacterium]
MIRDFIRDADTVALVGFVRLMLGGPLSLALGFVAWLMGWWFQGARVGTDTFFTVQGIITGVATGSVAAFFWWNTETPLKTQWIYAITVLAVAICSPLVVMQIAEIDTYNTLIGPSRRVAVIVKGDLISTMIFSSTIAANVVAAALGMYRMFRHREI